MSGDTHDWWMCIMKQDAVVCALQSVRIPHLSHTHTHNAYNIYFYLLCVCVGFAFKFGLFRLLLNILIDFKYIPDRQEKCERECERERKRRVSRTWYTKVHANRSKQKTHTFIIRNLIVIVIEKENSKVIHVCLSILSS